ncbi:MAG: hypothetical protein HRT82_10160 [Henriciella sp.]|jgi:hypothetical protein|nr:hypothetical protein [Henriciella sp.]
MTETTDQVKTWLNSDLTSLEDLYTELAKTSPQSNAMGGDLAKQGRAMLLAIRTGLHDLICKNDEISNHPAVSGGSDDINDTIALTAIIAAVIPSDLGTGVNATLIAVLIARIGVRNFCIGAST